MKTKCLYMSVIFCLVVGSLLTVSPVNAEGEPPVWPPEDFWNDPTVPSIFDWVTFGLNGYVPAGWSCAWDFGDGTTSNDCFVDHSKRYDQDGDYTVRVQVTKGPGETATASEVVSVRTHDVAITRFTVPTSAKAGQTRQIVVYVRNSRYWEKVQVELYKNVYDYPPAGTLIQDIPPRSANRTTAFSFSYTFTEEDARIGKVTFMAMAFILENGGDDWQVDNSVIAFPTRVTR